MKKAYFLPRALVLFVVFLAIGAGIFRFSTHHYQNIADWEDPASMEVLIYEDDTYHLAGEIGDPGLASKKYPKNEVLGEVTPDGLFDPSAPFVVWNVEGKANFLIVTTEDDKEWLYFREGVDNPAETETAETAMG